MQSLTQEENMATLVLRIRDRSGEYGSMSIRVREPDDALYTDYADYITQMADLVSKFQILAAGSLANWYLKVNETSVNDVSPTSPFAQRETKWLVRYRDAITNERFSFTIPCAALELITDPDTEELSLSNLALAFPDVVGTIEDHMVTKAGNATQIEGIRHVGRNT